MREGATTSLPVSELEWEAAIGSNVNMLVSGGDAASRLAVAREVYDRGHASRGPFVILNGTDLAWDPARRGFAFIEEVAALDERRQAALMRYLDQRSAASSGGFRIVAATHFDLLELIAQRRFSEALFYRLNVLHIILV